MDTSSFELTHVLQIFVLTQSLLCFMHPAQVIVMSATMDVDLFSEYFNKSPVLYLEGRQHPIQIYYTKQPQSDYLQAALISIFQIHQVVFGETLLAFVVTVKDSQRQYPHNA